MWVLVLFFSKKRKIIQPDEKNTIKKTVKKSKNCSFRIVPSVSQHIGSRENQEDAYKLTTLDEFIDSNDNGFLAVIADGIGGAALGEEASKTAVDVFEKEYNNLIKSNETLQERLKRAITIANIAVYDLAFNLNGGNMGTTLVAAVIFQEKFYWISVGDSRIYHYREGNLKQLTTDHIYANYLERDVARGLISRKEAEEHPERSYLTSHLGIPDLKEIAQSKTSLTILPEDIILLCTDGLTNTLTDLEICNLLDEQKSNPAEELVKNVLIKNKPYQDNVTVAVLSCLEIN